MINEDKFGLIEFIVVSFLFMAWLSVAILIACWLTEKAVRAGGW
jgi:hypothetical protein